MTANAAKSDTRNIISLAIADSESLSDIMCDSPLLQKVENDMYESEGS